jgi:hypothetical protein
MNKEYKNFFGGLDADVDIDSPKDFVNQVSDDENTDRSVSGNTKRAGYNRTHRQRYRRRCAYC